MAAVDKFNGILKGRVEFERKLDDWGRPQYREALMYVASEQELKDLAEATDATALLAEAIQAHSEDAESDKSLAKFRDATQVLFSTSDGTTLSESAVRTRFTTFTSSARSAFESLKTDKQPTGMLLNIAAPTSGVDTVYPDLSLLDNQRTALAGLIKWMGRQTGDKSWSEWFGEKFVTVKESMPKLASMGVWTGLGSVVNKLLDVGLIGFSIAGYSGHVVTFGANVLTPWQAVVEFPKLMEKQLVLYRLKEYGKDKLKLSDSSKVMKAIQTTIDSIDWSAVRTAFKVTPFGLLISVYSGAKFIVLKAKPSVGAYYDSAKELVDAADTLHTSGETNENNSLC